LFLASPLPKLVIAYDNSRLSLPSLLTWSFSLCIHHMRTLVFSVLLCESHLFWPLLFINNGLSSPHPNSLSLVLSSIWSLFCEAICIRKVSNSKQMAHLKLDCLRRVYLKGGHLQKLSVGELQRL
jgi:hypothetical protein